jgi:hypothetical protein
MKYWRYSPVVLLETFGSVNCAPCVEAAEALHGFTEDNPDGAYAIIEYFAWWPSQNDPFYEESSAGVDERVIQTYLVGVLPTTKIAGLHLDDPASQSEIANTYSNALDAHTGLPGVSLRQQLADGRLEVELEIFNFDAGNFGVDDRLFVAVIENSIYYEAPNNLTDFDYVFRGFVTRQTVCFTLRPKWVYLAGQHELGRLGLPKQPGHCLCPKHEYETRT